MSKGMRGTRALLSVSAAVTAALLVTGCGGAVGSGEGATESATPSPSRNSGNPSNSAGSSASPRDTHIDTTMTGMAVRGVEPGCVAIKTRGKTYQLAGDEARELAKQAGNDQKLGRVRVAGHFAPKGAASTCMMGKVFVAVKLKKL